MADNLQKQIQPILSKIKNGEYGAQVWQDVSMQGLCTFRIGGIAAYVILPQNMQTFCALIRECISCAIPYYILGGGSNVLPPDGYFAGVIIRTCALRKMTISRTAWIGDCGLYLNQGILCGVHAGLSGLERLYGIPATVGGAVRMNAGAHGCEVADTLHWVDAFHAKTGKRERFFAADLDFGYRHSLFQDDQNWIVLRACFSLVTANVDLMRSAIREVVHKRCKSQPLEYPNAGSIFRRPDPETEVWQLVEGCGARGLMCGGAQISTKHAGFIINRCHATAADVKTLIQEVQERVRRQYGIGLDPEVEIW